ncbi:iron ABC transporter substrate-binding protein [Bordetella genomosp. 8]|uniref:Iron ABC transporter substrate-binding protein n=1 Tax=Bordetella genomosp. 8 TaxID=1416806 RepID=A0A1W6YK97_9BORD|nr:MetQ/NlpA family ABC transporter substrate-binding protein [Bordetella genomosp. 8]ARP81526.1 iron ABC transporter substrate-binding protein [Bordetella genomosp. 8]
MPASFPPALSSLSFSPPRRRVLRALGAVAAGLAAAPIARVQAQPAPLRIGVIASVANEATEIAITQARDVGVNARLVEFADWVMPNVAVADGSIEANFFQHQPFLDLFNRSRGANLTSVAYGYSTTMGLFSKKVKRGEPMPHGASIGVPADPVNTGRALLLLQSMGLIRLKAGAAERATLLDVESNPLDLKFVAIEGAQAGRAFDDVTASATYTTFAKHGGLDEKDGLAFDNNDPDNVRRYAIRWVALPEHAQDARLLKFIEVYQQSPEVKGTLRRLYGDLIDFPW